jgi:pimeloyl-ACP methyl ester carboxylesterase
MLKITITTCALGLGLVSALAAAQDPDELRTSNLAELFGIAPTIGDPRLSPDGTQLIFLQQNEMGVTLLRHLALADGSVSTLLAGSEEGHDIVGCEFTNATRILCDLRRGIPGFDQDYQRFYLLNSDGEDLVEVRRGTGCTASDPLRNAYNINWLPEDEESIMFVCGGNVSVFNTQNRRLTNESGAGESGSAKRLYSDGHGLGNIYSGRINNIDHWYYRDDVQTDWFEFDLINPLDFDDPFRPVGYGKDTGSVYNIAWNADTKTWALFSRTLSGDFQNKLVITHPLIDLQLVDVMGAYERVVSVPFIDGRTRRQIIDPRVREVHAFVSGLLPDVEIEILDESWDQNIYLVRAKAGLNVGEFIIVDMEQETVQGIGSEYAHLAPFSLMPTQLVEIDARDGGIISGHLTLPVGTVGAVPAVIIPRAQATHEDVADPHYLVQFLAASGYAVLRINNRGPAEHGGWLPQRSVVGWSQSADDIQDAAQFLADIGVSEPDSICGVGKDYGAYAAVMTSLKYPDLLQCVVSISGILDPRSSAGAQRVGAASALSSDFLDEASPVKRANEIDTPLLLFHARNNPTVRMADHAVSLDNAMQAAGKPVEFIQYVYDNHDIERGPYRTDMLARIGDFLAEHIGLATLAEVEDPAAETDAEDDT